MMMMMMLITILQISSSQSHSFPCAVFVCRVERRKAVYSFGPSTSLETIFVQLVFHVRPSPDCYCVQFEYDLREFLFRGLSAHFAVRHTDTRFLIGLALAPSIAWCYAFFFGSTGHSFRRLLLVHSCCFLA